VNKVYQKLIKMRKNTTIQTRLI